MCRLGALGWYVVERRQTLISASCEGPRRCCRHDRTLFLLMVEPLCNRPLRTLGGPVIRLPAMALCVEIGDLELCLIDGVGHGAIEAAICIDSLKPGRVH